MIKLDEPIEHGPFARWNEFFWGSGSRPTTARSIAHTSAILLLGLVTLASFAGLIAYGAFHVDRARPVRAEGSYEREMQSIVRALEKHNQLIEQQNRLLEQQAGDVRRITDRWHRTPAR